MCRWFKWTVRVSVCWALQPWQSSRALWSYLVNSCHDKVMIRYIWMYLVMFVLVWWKWIGNLICWITYTYPNSYTHCDILKNTYLLTILHDWLGSKLLNSTASIVLRLNTAETSRQWERFITSQRGWLGWSDSTTRCANFEVSAANCSCMAKAGYEACSIQTRPRCEH